VAPLVTASELATYLQRDLDTASAEFAIAGASGVLRSYCRWSISRQTDVWWLNGGATVLDLPTLYVNEIVSVAVGDTTYDDHILLAGGQLYRADWWPRGYANVRVEADHGYAVIPDEVRLVACSIAARFYVNPEGLASKSGGDAGRAYTGLSQMEIGLVSGYRLP
jgi:hypothetical protein